MRVEFRVRVLTDAGEKFFGEGPDRLLRGVERLGSLRAAAGELGMAYSKASRIMARAEQFLGAPLTRRRIGGPDGGGSALTPLARELLARYDALRADCEATVKASFARNFGDLPAVAVGDMGCPSREERKHFSGESTNDAKDQGNRAVEPECAVEARDAIAEENSAQNFDDLFVVAKGDADDKECPSREERKRSSGESTNDAKGRKQSPGESAPTGLLREAEISESSRRSEEESAIVQNCSHLAAEDCERRTGESALTTKTREAAGESSCCSGGACSVAEECSSSLAGVQRPGPDESASTGLAREAEASASSGQMGEASAMVGCVVLAAGRARRFGGGKLLVELGGRPVLARTLEALPRECFCRVVVVTSDPAVSALCRELGFSAREYPGGALSDSIREGLVEMDCTDGCAFVNGDQPLLRPASLRRLAAAFASAPEHVYRLSHGGTAASPVIFPASAYPALRALTGERGGMAALKSGEWEVRTVEAEEESELWDVDDPAALRRVEARLRGDSGR